MKLTVKKAIVRNKIKSHLRRKGDAGDFYVTPTFVLHWWRLLNFALFDSKLNLPENILIKNWKDGTLGECWAQGYSKKKPVIICISQDLEDRQQFLSILAHEMVHQWEQQTTGRMSHGPKFFAWKNKLKQLGIPLYKHY